jgi:hypothetical protein
MMMSQEQMDVFGYKTKNFDICPGAQDLFTHITSMPMDEDTKGMVRSAAQIADNVFEIEREVLIRGYSTEEELAMAKILVDDFKDLMKEIDALVGMNHDVSFMDNHIELITAALDDPQYWDEDEKELFAAVNFFKENPDKKPLNFNQFFTGLNRGDILGKTVFRNNTKFYEYAVKVSGKEPTKDCRRMDLWMEWLVKHATKPLVLVIFLTQHAIKQTSQRLFHRHTWMKSNSENVLVNSAT